MEDIKPEPRKRGPRRRLEGQEKFSTNLTASHREKLERYAVAHNISIAEAIRRAIDLLVGAE
jgi:hypothetical protein